MKSLTYKNLPKVTELPLPSEELNGVLVNYTTLDAVYFCNGYDWIDLTAQRNVFIQPMHPGATGSPFLWIQTGIPSGDNDEVRNGITFWVEDGK